MPVVGSNFVFEIKDQQVLGSQPVENVWYYVQTTGATPVDASLVGAAFSDIVIDALIQIQSTGLSHVTLEVQQLASLTNFVVFAISGKAGDQTGQGAPSHDAWKVRILRTSKETREGAKRIAGLTEGNIAGDFIDAAVRSNFDAVLSAIDVPLTVDGQTLELAIVGGKKDPATGEQKPADEWIYQLSAGLTTGYEVTTQNSRKR